MGKREGSHIWIPIQENKMVAMVPKGHPLEADGVVPLESFVMEPYINTYHKAGISGTGNADGVGAEDKSGNPDTHPPSCHFGYAESIQSQLQLQMDVPLSKERGFTS